MMEHKPSLTLLFSQLGLANSPAAIELYIRTHQLLAHQNLHDAPFWNRGQREFLISHLVQDDDWAIWIDELNQQLHMDASKLRIA
jgi:sugar diacid utilization regulator